MYGVQGASASVLSGYERGDLAAGVGVVNQLVYLGVGAAAVWTGLGYYGLIVANLLGVASMTWICWHAAQRLNLRPVLRDASVWLTDVRNWGRLLRASAPFGIVTFTLGLSYKFDSVLLAVTRSDSETGFYNAAYNLVFSAVLVSNILNGSLFPSLTRRVQSSSEGLSGVYGHAIRYLMIVALPIAAGACLLADRLVPLLYGPAYEPTISALRIVIWAVPLMSMTELFGYIAIVQNREHHVARAVTTSTGVNLALNLLLVPRFGFLAASIMTVVTEAVLAGQYFWLLRHTLHGVELTRPLLRPAAACAGMALVLLILHDLPVLALVAIGALVYGGLLLLLGVLGRDDLRLFEPFLFRRPRATAP
jgi:O-antigen/teichoic acid export membrane protein